MGAKKRRNGDWVHLVYAVPTLVGLTIQGSRWAALWGVIVGLWVGLSIGRKEQG